ncbi:39S ribosomal protein L35, mitochondrial isoform X3 [Gallus gallus]|uniref:39S ribosomal protein L35, mitochondrial isoform X3 n=1 Tax=Gallus gallus TaxID=9031 RepID=UPI001AE16055|nr:39S ribosomal protein L35, mitochondrial isoform X3 [Gallus gallus]
MAAAAARGVLAGMLRPLARWAPLAAWRTASVRCCHSPARAATPLGKPLSLRIVPGGGSSALLSSVFSEGFFLLTHWKIQLHYTCEGNTVLSTTI